MEFFIYVINPLLFLPLLFLTGVVMATIPLVAYIVTATIIVTLAIPSTRTSATTYVSNNFTMVAPYPRGKRKQAARVEQRSTRTGH